jgi:hypothetical protein
MNTAELKILIKADDKASKALQDIEKQVGLTSNQVRNMGLGMVAGGVAIGAALGVAVKAAADEQAGVMRLDTAMRNMGLSYDLVKGSLESWIDAQQQKTSVADDAQRDSLASLITMTGNLASAQDYLTLAMDISAGTGRDLSSATQLVEQALAGNWGTLERYIPSLKSAQTEEEKWYDLRETFIGQAETYGNSFEGQMQTMKNNIDDVKEALGAAVIEAIQPAVSGLSNLILTIKDNANPELMKLVAIIGVGGAGGLTLVGGMLLIVSQAPKVVAAINTMGWSVKALSGELVLLTAGIGMMLWGFNALSRNAEIERLNVELAKGYTLALQGQNDEYVKALQHKEAMGIALNAEEKAYIEAAAAQNTYNASLKAQAQAEEVANQKMREAIALLNEKSAASNRDVVRMAYLGQKSAQGGTLTPEQEAEWTELFKRTSTNATKTQPTIPEGAYEIEGGYYYDPKTGQSIPGYAEGGRVERTGLALVHAGETVIPRERGIPANINIYLDGRLISQTFLEDIMRQVSLQGGR